jgi:hypothetical protein
MVHGGLPEGLTMPGRLFGTVDRGPDRTARELRQVGVDLLP